MNNMGLEFNVPWFKSAEAARPTRCHRDKVPSKLLRQNQQTLFIVFAGPQIVIVTGTFAFRSTGTYFFRREVKGQCEFFRTKTSTYRTLICNLNAFRMACEAGGWAKKA